ncbi:very low-density lipoprotein receptor-like [Ptychodera flava]|uniref:very low-density lipoprotein receptor-like n=1 Tax=Ptychodera flava TaxID=63121 RepID=UPI00396AA892
MGVHHDASALRWRRQVPLHNGRCIDANKLCDFHDDCGDWSDEPPQDKCNVDECMENNGGCSQLCHDLKIGHYCTCNEGYELLDDGKTCQDIDECAIPGTCSQKCENTKGGFKCSCIENYELDGDHKRCKPIGEDPLVLFANRMDIREINPAQNEYREIVKDLRSAVALDYHYQKGLLYWTDVGTEQILRIPMTGEGEPQVILHTDVNTPDGIAVDWIYENIYWTDTGTNVIEVAHLNDIGNVTSRTILIDENLDEPRAIVVDPLEGFMYWSDWGEPAKIERAGMNGMDRSVLVDTEIQWPNGLTIDYVTRRIFWADAKLHLLGSCDLHGSDRVNIITSESTLPHPFAITVFGDDMYWTDWETEQIHKANKFTGGGHITLTEKLYSPMGIHVYHSVRQQSGINHCGTNNGKCSHLCVAAPQITVRSAKYSCMCPPGVTLLDDGHTCDVAGVTPHPDLHRQGQSTIAPYATTETSEKGPSYIDSGMAVGKLAGIIVGAVLVIVLIVAVIAFFCWRNYINKSKRSMNFDNPVYRKTTEDQFCLEKYQHNPGRTYPPLTGVSTDEHV